MRAFKLNPIARAVLTVGVVTGLAGGVTYAALQSQATLTGSSIDSGTASLLLWDGSTFASTAPGFTVTGLIPGVGKEYSFYFKNGGDIPLKISAKVPSAPTASGFSGWENLKVTITDEEGGTPAVTNTNMAELLAGKQLNLVGDSLQAGAQGNSGVAGTEGNFKIKFDIDPTSVDGSHASVGVFNIDFNGAQ